MDRQISYSETQRIYDWGLRTRMELVPTARKVYRDFTLLADQEPEGAAVVAALESIIREADRWHDRSVGVGPAKGRYVEVLPPDLDLPHEEILRWSKVNDELFNAVNQLGTYCHFRLKERHRGEAASAAVPADPLLSKDDYRELKRKNTLLNNLEILLGRTHLESYPLRMELDPTNECNLRCRGCRHGITKDFHHIEMRRDYVEVLSEAFPFVDYLYPIGTGEPTMSSTLPMIVREAARHEVKVDLLTNGTLLEKAVLPWDAFYRLGISIDGANEETMRALRPVAPLAQTLAALQTLRSKAPQATIYVKVTVSRMNYDELPALVEKLAEVGVNEVIVHSLDVIHPMLEAIQVRALDRPHMMQCVETARDTATSRGMAFVNALNFDAAACHHEDERDKNGMFQVLKDTPLPILHIRELPGVLEKLQSASFNYHPSALVRAAGLSPGEGRASASANDRPAGVGIDTIDQVIQERIRQARALTAEQVQIPYCFLPWKMPIVAPDGRAKACCHLPGHLGDLDHGENFVDLWSSPGYVELRESMFHVEKLPDVCAGCQEFDRSAYSDETLALADLLAAPIRQAPRYPVPMDIARLLRSINGSASRKFEILGNARQEKEGRFVIPPDAQILARFPNPKTAAGVYYKGKFHFSGGQLLVGIKPLWGNDLWHYMLDSAYTSLLGDWVGLPMPPLPLNFSGFPEEECCVFLWAPRENRCNVEVRVKEFSGVASAAGPCQGDGLQIPHLWLGKTATK